MDVSFSDEDEAFLAQQLRFAEEFQAVVRLERDRGLSGDPVVRQRLAQAHTGLEIMRVTGLAPSPTCSAVACRGRSRRSANSTGRRGTSVSAN